MLIHIRYNDYVPEVEQMSNFEKNIKSSSKTTVNKYEDNVNKIVENLEKEYDIDSDGIHFVYADWDNINSVSEPTIVNAFHPDNYDDWVQEPILYIKSSTEINNWEDSFEENILNGLKNEIFYDIEF